jgi:hypothetical protein
MTKIYLFAGEAAFALVAVELESPAGAVAFVFALTPAGGTSAVAEFVFEAAGDSAGVSGTELRTEVPPLNAGIDIRRADSMKIAAAAIVIFDSTVAVPLGPNALLEILLVNNAPASVLPG